MRFPFSSYKLFKDFVLFEHSSFGNPRSTMFLGVDSSGSLIIQDYDIVSQNRKDKDTINLNTVGKIVNITTQNFLKTSHSYLITSKGDSNRFNNILYSKTKTKSKIDIGESDAVPFVVTDPKTLQPLIVLSSGSTIKFYSFKDGEQIEISDYQLDGSLSNRHTSHFLDLSGDMRANLALHMESNGNNYLGIYDFNSESKQLIQRLPLPSGIGPLLYFDSAENGAYDLIYVNIENGNSFLNIHKNRKVPNFTKVTLDNPEEYFDKISSGGLIYNENPDFKFNLLSLINGTAVIRDEDDMPTGLFLTDINTDGSRRIIITMREDKTTRLRCLEYGGDGELKVDAFDAKLNEYKNILGVSALDVYDRGKDDILINCVIDGKPHVVVEKVMSPDVNSKLSALTCLSNTNHSLAHLPGVTYLINYDDGNKWRKVSQMTTTSYKSLQHQSAFIGLGQSNFFLNFVLARTNSMERQYDHYIVRGIIVPNTSVVFLVKKDKWVKQSFFLLNRYYVVAISLIGILIFNSAILVYLTIKEKSVVSKSVIANKQSVTVFGTL